ncbi:MBL fold metallo-hydrolase [Carnobacteriaceae bacterium zg-C25]|nr:MBL fold metallo-hydrolase [Carnobacteriaceae bacterium zg-C25]
MSNWAMKVSMLASGSSGNVTFVETPTQQFLVDAGLSGKRIEKLLEQIGKSAKNINGIFVTHEHIDHIKGVGILARKYQIPIYANEKTWQVIEQSLGNLSLEQKMVFLPNSRMTIGDIDVCSFDVSHDAIHPQFYAFERNDEKFVMLTDTGYVPQRLKGELQNASLYLMESNHDVELLRAGRYPWSTKQRILSDKGHLSNEDGALAVGDMLGNKTKRIYLGHLSSENNMKSLAKTTVESVLKEMGKGVNHDFIICDTDPEVPTTLITL